MQIILFTDFSPIYKKKTKHEYFLPYNKLNFFINIVKPFIICLFRTKTKTKLSKIY